SVTIDKVSKSRAQSAGQQGDQAFGREGQFNWSGPLAPRAGWKGLVRSALKQKVGPEPKVVVPWSLNRDVLGRGEPSGQAAGPRVRREPQVLLAKSQTVRSLFL